MGPSTGIGGGRFPRSRHAGWPLAVLLLAACGGGGGATPVPPPIVPPAADSVTIRYLRADPAYDGWGLHLWGSAIGTAVQTTWQRPRPFDRIEDGAAVFEVPVVNTAGELNFILHNGDLKSPVFDLSIVPRSFGSIAWVVQDRVAAVVGGVGVPFDDEAVARAALDALGNASAVLDLSPVVPNPVDSGLPADWATRAAFVEIYVRGYQDSDGDGIGDLQGLISRLDYLQALGVTGIWLMPVTESADNDHGYAVEDYRDIEDDYGSMADFEQLLAEAHARGIGVIIDYVMNHSASTNPLFLDATTMAANDKRDWYVWEDRQPTGWNTFAGDPWRNNGNGWYYGVFSATMPDFNLDNPEVAAYHADNLRFWLNKGVDGFRFDAVGVLFENGPNGWEDQPENHLLLDGLRGLVEQYGNRFMVCEAPSAPADYAAANSCGRAFAFGVQGAVLESARSGMLDAALAMHLARADADRMPLFLSNHDRFAGDRSWNQLNGDTAAYRLAAASYLLATATPFTWYGEEIGMANAAALGGDHALRTPMSWTADPQTAGFSTVPPFRALSANSVSNNVELQSGNAGSLLESYRSLLALRRDYPVIATGAPAVHTAGGDPVLVLTRTGAGSVAVIAINYSDAERSVSVDTGTTAAFVPVFGTVSGVITDAAGGLAFDIAARSAAVLVAGS